MLRFKIFCAILTLAVLIIPYINDGNTPRMI